MKIRTADQYLTRYHQIGAQRAPKTHRRDSVQGLRDRLWPQDNLAYRSRPNHAARAVALPLAALGPRRRPKQLTHPATEPLSAAERVLNYRFQDEDRTGAHRPLTPRQQRRIDHKSGHAIAAAVRAEGNWGSA